MEEFTSVVRSKLIAAKRAGQKAATKEEASRTDSTEEEATSSVALVLRSRKDRVDDWYDNHYGKSLRSISRSYKQNLSDAARSAGREAGSHADIGQTRLRGQKGLNK